MTLKRGSAPHPLVVGAVVLATVLSLEIGARIILYGNDAWRPDYRVAADGYFGAPWVRSYYREFLESGDVDWHPYVYWRRRPFSGDYINVDKDGVRRSWQPSGLGADPPTVFVFGGSTVWGTGSRDEWTLPSQIGRQLAAAGEPVKIVNYGESGYVLRQAVDTLIDRLERGDVPRAAIFYSGVEDTFSALQNGEAGLPQNEGNRRLEFNATQPQNIDKVWHVMTAGLERLGSLVRGRFVPDAAAAAATGQGQDALADRVAAAYCDTARVAAALGREYGFAVRFYWQPVSFTKRAATPYEARVREQYGYARGFFGRVYERMGRTEVCSGINFRDLSRIFDAETQPMYIDAFHLTEHGNATVAEPIAQDITPLVRQTPNRTASR